jgi:hypothetical protein
MTPGHGYSCVNSRRYTGKFCHGRKHGQGRLTFLSEDSRNREEFEGQFENEEIVHGRYVSETGDSYDGDWLDGRSHGKGKYRFVDGEEYEGDWKDGKMHGKMRTSSAAPYA